MYDVEKRKSVLTQLEEVLVVCRFRSLLSVDPSVVEELGCDTVVHSVESSSLLNASDPSSSSGVNFLSLAESSDIKPGEASVGVASKV